MIDQRFAKIFIGAMVALLLATMWYGKKRLRERSDVVSPPSMGGLVTRKEAMRSGGGKQAPPQRPAPAAAGGVGAEPSPDANSSIRKNEEAKASFARDAKIKIPFPGGMQYARIDYEDGMAVIAGRSGRMGLTMFAKAEPVTQTQVVDFLKRESASIPASRGAALTALAKPRTLAPVGGSGLGEATWWTGTLSDGKQLHAVLLPRRDGHGNYLIVFSGSANSFDDNEEFFGKMYQQIKAEPF